MKNLLLSFLTVMILMASLTAEATTRSVPSQYPTISAAITAATPGDIIQISSGIYNERLVISKSLTITGSGESGCILDGTALGNGKGIEILSGVTNVVIQQVTIRNFSGNAPNNCAGIYADGGNTGLEIRHVTSANNVGGCGIYIQGPVDNIVCDYVTAYGHTNVAGAARGIVIWNGMKSHITITNCNVYNNNCCGIELQDGTASGVTMSNNNIHDNSDSGMGLIGLTSGAGPNYITNNTLNNNGRFGIEVKLPKGSGLTSGDGCIVVSGNNVTGSIISDNRDKAGISVYRRGWVTGSNNTDIPTGVQIFGNTVSGYTQSSVSEGFGIVVEGTNHTVSANILNGNDVGIQKQSGHLPYSANTNIDGDQNNLNDNYFGRGNSPVACAINVSNNTFSGNGTNYREVVTISGPNYVMNATTGNSYCDIQSAIDAANPGNTLQVGPGTYTENIDVTKALTIVSMAGAGTTTIVAGNANQPIIRISSDAVTITGFTISNPSGVTGIYAEDHSQIAITNNIITQIGTTCSGASSTVTGISVICTSSPVSDITITGNNLNNIVGTFGTSMKSVDAIAVGWSNGNQPVNNLLIQNNSISNILSWNGTAGRGAYGILINHGSPASGGQTANARILNNTISLLHGLWAHGIALEGNTPGAIVQDNNIFSLTDHKSPADPDAAAIMIEDNSSAASINIFHNQFTNVWPGIRNATGISVNAEQNFWGGNVPDFSKLVTGTVDFDPYCNSTFSICNLTTGGGPVTFCGKVISGTNSVTIPVTVQHCNNADAISLDLSYNTSVLNYVSYTKNAALTGLFSINIMNGHIVVAWTGNGSNSVTLPDDSQLLSFTFTRKTGGTALFTWNDTNGNDCEYQNHANQLPYYDLPAPDFYKNGWLTDMAIAFTRSYSPQNLTAVVTGGNAPYTYSWTGPGGFTAGNVAGINLPNVYGDYIVTVTDNLGAVITGTYNYNRVHNINTMLDYATIQAANDAVQTANGNVITVDEGNYYENIVITKALDLRGPNYDISPNSGIRLGEANLYPATSDPDPASNTCSTSIYITASGSGTIINGFTIDGDNPNLTSGLDINGADVDAIEAIAAYDGISNVKIRKNRIWNLSYSGIDFYNYYNSGAATTGNEIDDNYFDNIIPASYGIGVLIYNNCYTNITNNVMERVRLGVQTGNFSQADPGNSRAISGNSITSGKLGIWNNLVYGTASPLSITGNTLATVDGYLNNTGIEISTIQGNRSVVVSGNSVTGAMAGIQLWSNPTTQKVTVDNNTLTDCNYGVFANNYDGYSSNAAAGVSSYVLNNVIINSPKIAGIYIKDNSLCTNNASVAVEVKGNTTISGNVADSKAFMLEGADVSLTFTGTAPQATVTNLPKYFVLQSNGTNVPAGNIDATQVSFNGSYGSAMTLPVLYQTENKNDHKIDNAALGFVKIKDLNTYVTASSFLPPVTTSPSIQRGVDAAGVTGWTVNVDAGTFAENILVNKSVVISGAKAGEDVNTRFAAFTTGKADPSVESVVTAPANNPLGGNPGANDLFRVVANNVAINGFVLDGNNPALGASTLKDDNNLDIHGRRGITNIGSDNGFNPLNNLNVSNNIFQNFSQRCISLHNNGPVSSGNLIQSNLFRNFGWDPVNGGQAVILFYNAYSDIVDNTIDVPHDQIGLHLQNFYSNGTMTWSGNNVTVGDEAIGIHVNMLYAASGVLNINGNTVNAAAGVTGTTDFTWGINIWSIQTTSTVNLNNNIVGNAGGTFSRGINLWNLPTTNFVTINGGSVGRAVVGINADNVDPFYGSAGNSTVNINSVAVSGGTTGIRARTQSLETAPQNGSNIPSGSVVLKMNAVSVTGADYGILSQAPAASGIYTAGVKIDNSEINTCHYGVNISGANAGLISAGNNFIRNNTIAGINIDAAAGTIGQVNNNDLSGNPALFAINNSSATVVPATCNWWGTNTVAGVNGMKTGSVNNDPWLTVGSDNEPFTAGFQPVPNSCSGAANLFVNDGTYNGDDIYTFAQGNNSNTGTAALPFLTITKAVSTAMEGTSIWVDAGNFQEQVFISKNLNITGNSIAKTTVLAPLTMSSVPVSIWSTNEPVHPVIYAGGNTNTVNISNLTIDGNGGRNVNRFFGALYYQANGTLDNCKITGIHDSPVFSGVQSGVAYYAGHTRTVTMPQTVTISNSQIVDYQKGGIVVDAPGIDGTIINNIITGQNTPNISAQNGIQLSRGATGTITNNTVSNNLWNKVEHPHQYTAAGILIYQASTANISGNILNGNEEALTSSESLNVTYGINTFNNNNIHVNLENASLINAGNIYDKRVDNPAQTNIIYGCIQHALDQAASAATINAGAGTFKENVNIHTSVTLNGPNADIDPTVTPGLRVAEAVVMPAVNDYNNGRVMDVKADNVTVNGFTIDGDNPSLSGGTSFNGADINTEFGIASGVWSSGTGGKNNMIIKYNIVKNCFDGGIYGNGGGTPVSGGLFTYNLIDNNPWWGIVMENNCYTNLTHNKITRVSRGIQFDNYYNPKPGGGDAIIEFNNITYNKRGILQNLDYGSGSRFIIRNNTLTVSSTPETANVGLAYWSVDDNINATATNNTINPGEQGIRIWNCQGNVTIDANTVNGGQYGLYATTNDAYGLGTTSGTVFTNNTLSNPLSAGIYLEDTDYGSNSVSVTATNNIITGGPNAVKISGNNLTATVNNNSITGQTGAAVDISTYTGSGIFDFNCNWWGTTVPAMVAAKVGAANPPVNYIPWLSNGTDDNVVAGFQPVTGSCDGYPLSSLTGTVKYFNSAQTPMNNVVITLTKGAGSVSATTNSIGEYSFSNIESGTYNVTFATVKPVGGINATDAAQVNYWGVNISPIEKVRFMAGDVAGSDITGYDNELNSSDAGRIVQYFVTMGNTPFNSQWSFCKLNDFISVNPLSSRVVTVSLAGNNSTQNFLALENGDFNRSFVPGGLKGISEHLTLETNGAVSPEPGVVFDLPVYITSALDLTAISMILDIPSDKIEVISVFLGSDPGAQLQFATDQNELRIGWQSAQSHYLNPGDRILTLRLKMKISIDQPIRINLAGDDLNELAGGDYNTADATLFTSEILAPDGISDLPGNGDLTFANYPNPFKEQTSFTYNLPESGHVTLEIFSLLGSRIITLCDNEQNAGDHQVSLNSGFAGSGVYLAILKLNAGSKQYSRMIKIISGK